MELQDMMFTITIGTRVSGHIHGQSFTGTVRNTAHRNGSHVYAQGTLTTTHAGDLESIVIATDNTMTTPIGRTVKAVCLRRSEFHGAQLALI